MLQDGEGKRKAELEEERVEGAWREERKCYGMVIVGSIRASAAVQLARDGVRRRAGQRETWIFGYTKKEVNKGERSEGISCSLYWEKKKKEEEEAEAKRRP